MTDHFGVGVGCLDALRGWGPVPKGARGITGVRVGGLRGAALEGSRVGILVGLTEGG